MYKLLKDEKMRVAMFAEEATQLFAPFTRVNVKKLCSFLPSS